MRILPSFAPSGALRRHAAFGALLRLATLGTLGATVVGHLGALHPALDSFAHLRVQLLGLAALLVVACVLTRLWRSAAALAVVGALSALLTLPYWVGVERDEAREGDMILTVLQQNYRFDNARGDAFLARVAEVAPDVIAVQEVSAAADASLAVLSGDYPFQHRCRGAGFVGDVVIASRGPFVGWRRCAPGLAVARIRVEGREVALGSLHLHWPWPFGQPRHIETLVPHVPRIGAPDVPGVLLGDFNATTWSHAVRRVAAMMGGRAVRGLGGTRIEPDLPRPFRSLWDIPIDQAIVTPDIRVLAAGAVALEGSDHDTLVLRLALAPRPEERVARRNADATIKDARHAAAFRPSLRGRVAETAGVRSHAPTREGLNSLLAAGSEPRR